MVADWSSLERICGRMVLLFGLTESMVVYCSLSNFGLIHIIVFLLLSFLLVGEYWRI